MILCSRELCTFARAASTCVFPDRSHFSSDNVTGRLKGIPPNIDVTLESVAAFAGQRELLQFLTGMGNDGAADRKRSKPLAELFSHRTKQLRISKPAEAIKTGLLIKFCQLMTSILRLKRVMSLSARGGRALMRPPLPSKGARTRRADYLFVLAGSCRDFVRRPCR